MNQKILPHLTTAQAILILVAANLISMGYLLSLTNYNHDVATSTQKQIINLVNNQGNFSNAQRIKILNEFENLPSSGFASSEQQEVNHHLLVEILGNVTRTK